jgi:hypothetical protein
MGNTSSSAERRLLVAFRFESNKFYLMATSDVLRGIA